MWRAALTDLRVCVVCRSYGRPIELCYQAIVFGYPCN